ncbi:MAG: YicC/YloC family endoribonuclease [Bacteroidales bacterium]|nr:YicC family protein [Bacteroidales bacterium]MDY0215482.1 YicC/YloC family endoribonuclease [Bacteroidales bacterium]
MIKSMTGFGRQTYQYNDKIISIELRTLNSKIFDLTLKTPAFIRERETEIRNILSSQLERGKIELYITQESSLANTLNINKTLFESYYYELKSMSDSLKNSTETDIFSLVLRMPDIFSKEQNAMDEEDWKMFEKNLFLACSQVNEFRQTEGDVLKDKLMENITQIGNLLTQVTPFEEQRIKSVRDRLSKHVEKFLSDAQIDKNRFEQEIIFYLEKLDITEEKVRLKKHLDFFVESINESKSNGKKLGFMTQEIGREINTLGSKANDFEIQQLVVKMKDELEQIKEQLGNIL